MLAAVIFAACLWFCFLVVVAWFSAFNWLVTERVFPRDVSVGVYLRTFLTTPVVISMILTEGVTKKILNRYGKE